MTCDRCSTKYSYSFYINAEQWKAVTGGPQEGHICAHCVLEALGGVDWYIIFNEPLKNARTSTYEGR